MTSEEAAQIGSIAALNPDDLVYAQYREAGVIFYRGFTVSRLEIASFDENFDDVFSINKPVINATETLTTKELADKCPSTTALEN